MPRCLAVILVALLSVTSAAASETNAPQLAQNAQAPKNANMAEVAVGDHWTYELKDEITGAVTQTRRVIVTDLSGGQVATRFDIVQNRQSGNILYDKSWNILRAGTNRYTPNDGTGVQLPLKLDTKWKTSADEINGTNGNVWKINVNSRVTGQESITTKAGTFQSYIVETIQAVRNTKDPTVNSEVTIRTWFSPEINHWVKRNTVRRQRGLVVRNDTMELTEYGRQSSQ